MGYQHKSKLFFLLIILTGYNVYSQDNLYGNFSFNFGDMGIGYNNSTNNEIKNFELNLSLANMFFEYPKVWENSKARIGIKISPFNFRVLPSDKTFTMSFANVDIYTDFLSSMNKHDNRMHDARLGPFASINWLLFEGKHFKPESYIFNAGLRFSLSQPENFMYRFNWIDFDIGYRRINNTNNIYFTIKFEFFYNFIFIPALLRNSA